MYIVLIPQMLFSKYLNICIRKCNVMYETHDISFNIIITVNPKPNCQNKS